MAERRMISECIWCSDAFEALSTKAQQLYKHLYFAADDDGFCDCPRQIMNKVSARNAHMNELVDKKFVLKFDEPVVAIKHWRLQNQIRKDRYKPTKYLELLNTLYIDENKSYSKKPGKGKVPVYQMATGADTNRQPNGIPNDNQTGDTLATQYSIGKCSLEESSISKDNNTLNSSIIQEGEIGGLRGEEHHSDLPDRSDWIKERTEYWKNHIAKCEKLGWDTDGLKRMAAEEGVIL